MYDEDDYGSLDELTGKKKSKKRSNILDDLRDIEDSDFDIPDAQSHQNSSVLPDYMLGEPKKKKKKKKDEDDYDPDEWFDELLSYQGGVEVSKKNSKGHLFGDDIFGKKKKKKKKGKNGNLVDFKQEFEPEMALYKNLLVAQNKFTDSLQREYDAIKSVKSSSRGVSKQMSDLIENITAARSLSMQLVDKHVNAKKLIADLTLKQKKEFGITDGDGNDMSNFASNYLREMINNRQQIVDPTGQADIADYSEEELNLEIDEMLEDDERPEEIDKYLEYENRDVTIYVVITDDDVENYEFEARDSDDNVIYDYPMPGHTKLSINRSTNIATDAYGQKFQIEWR